MGLSLCELSWIPFEPLLAGYAAKMVGFAIMGDLELSCLLVQNRAAHRISRHMLVLWRMCVLLIMISVKGRKKWSKRTKMLLISLISSGRSSFRIAFSAVYRSASVGFERDFAFLSTVCTDCLVCLLLIHFLFSTPLCYRAQKFVSARVFC